MDVDLIQVVNKLQETFTAIGGDSVDLPQIVVVGSQSAGKSSVLETIVGRDFLPRGSGIITRRPLVLQLIHTPSAKDQAKQSLKPSPRSYDLSDDHAPDMSRGGSNGSSLGGGRTNTYEEYGEFLHLDKRFTDFNEIRREIENETFRVAGQNKGVSKLPIHLKIYSPNVLNLTLVDLPGLTKIPVGDQPSDIERQIRNLVTDYVSKPNCIILAVSPANVDLANSDSLKLARTVDPQGRRTVGVLTKLDLMDQGTHALDILTGRVYPLKLGFIGVVNRSQQDINGNVSMLAARRAEEEFFRSHAAYKNIAHRCGTKYLAKTLNQVLMSHIRDKLPDMKARLNTLMGQTQQELAAFGDTTFLGDQHRGSLVLKLMTQFARDFVASIDGTTFDISTKELCGGARIYYIFQDVFGHALTSINPTHNLTVQDIRTAIRNSTGPRPSLFVPEAAFELLIKPQIKLLEPPSLRCVELVYEELMKICHNCTSSELQRFPRLHAQLIEVVSELLRERLGPTSEYVQSLIAIQAAYINTNHPAFVHDSANIAREQREAQARKQVAILPSSSRRKGSFDDQGDVSNDLSDDDADNSGNSRSLTVNGVGKTGGARDKKERAASTGDGRPHSASAPDGRGHHTIGHASAGGYANGANAAGGAKDTFLNYFFGGASGLPVGGVGPSSGLGGYHTPAPHAHSPRLPEYSTSREHKPNAMSGRTGLEGNSAAYDMKSLDKHLEATPISSAEYALSDREELETTLIRSLIASYFSIVRLSIQDLVPKAIMHLLVNFSRESVQNRLVASLYKETLFEELLYEDEGLTSERKRVKQLLDAYREAFNTLSEVTFKPAGSA
ncbi:Dynamin, GTPase domain protein [Kalmanozyma brasiliensis GHG001]|uniref:dynamin GTPase n=1 Tax=Kalmanozyma brasiliensis (strain GHG001) TaxID=1365824 RepID=V5EQ07_KALBG|nr:Dynamin, GTPase domain protein [Kalmanozyma brasiliensis GHG001]EST07195.1 Dynamin, GTPase domain protein [Kalmanozyma brasiliensis GHG001]